MSEWQPFTDPPKAACQDCKRRPQRGDGVDSFCVPCRKASRARLGELEWPPLPAAVEDAEEIQGFMPGLGTEHP